jgi:hypothetical protein
MAGCTGDFPEAGGSALERGRWGAGHRMDRDSEAGAVGRT